MTINSHIIPMVLFKPEEAFKSIKETTTLSDGILLAFIFSVILGVISLAGSFLISKNIGFGMYGMFFENIGMSYFLLILMALIQIIISVVWVFAVGWLSAKFAKSLFKGTENVKITIGFLGYGCVVGFVLSIINIIISFIFLKDFFGVGFNPFSAEFWIAWSILMLVGLAGLIWVVYVNGAAVCIANNIKFLEGIITYIISAIIAGIVFFIILAIPMMLFMSVLFFGEGGMFGNFEDTMNITQIAVEEGNASICYNIPDPWSNMREMCVMNVAEKTNNVSLCYNITRWLIYRDPCIMEIAINTKNLTLCEEISNNEYKNFCRREVMIGNKTNKTNSKTKSN